MMSVNSPILRVNNLVVDFPVFGGLIARTKDKTLITNINLVTLGNIF